MATRNRPSPSDGLEGIEHSFIRLSTKPSAQINYTFVEGSQNAHQSNIAPPYLVVFLNGIDTSRDASWSKIIRLLKTSKRTQRGGWLPPMFAYDRFGIGGTKDPDPGDAGKPFSEAHDAMDVVRDLGQLLTQLCPLHLHRQLNEFRLIFIAHSMGSCFARLYAQLFPCTVAAAILIETTITNLSALDMIPDPKHPNFSPEKLPLGVTGDDCEVARAQLRKAVIFAEQQNRENLRWTNMPALLPFNDGPKLPEILGFGFPFVTVMRNDPEVNRTAWKKVWKIHEKILFNIEDLTSRYYEGLPKITAPHRSKGLIVAKGAGHNIPMDTPDLVVAEIEDVLDKISTANSVRSFM